MPPIHHPARNLFFLKSHLYHALLALQRLNGRRMVQSQEHVIAEIVHLTYELSEQLRTFFLANGLADIRY